jgi:hypothetical protein
MIFVIFTIRMLTPFFPDHKIERYENSLRAADGSTTRGLERG